MTTETKLTKYQKFEVKRIHRSQIKEAKYNPRAIDKENAARLKKNIKTKGLLNSLVWNKRTGNLVSGHRRLENIDALEGSLDYYLDVAVVDLSEKEEKEQNIFFNNPNAQGYFDIDMMKKIIGDIDFDEAGFNDEDISMLGVELDLETHESEDIEKVMEKFDEIKKEEKAEKEINKSPETKDWKQVKKEIKEQQEAQNNEHDNYVTITFSNHDAKAKFMERFGYEGDDKFIKGEIFQKKIERIE